MGEPRTMEQVIRDNGQIKQDLETIRAHAKTSDGIVSMVEDSEAIIAALLRLSVANRDLVVRWSDPN